MESNINLETATRPELFAECKKLGIKIERTDDKEKLVKRLMSDSQETQETDPNNGYQSDFVPESVPQPQQTPTTIPTYTPEDAEEMNINIQVEAKTIDGFTVTEVLDECNAEFAGRATAKYDRDNNPHCIEFHGGPRRRQDTTLHQPKSSVLFFAKTFCARAQVGKQSTGSIDGVNSDMDIESMTPKQRAHLKSQIEDLMRS